ncbi:MAG: DsrE/DsrF/DrsH-like family protein [Pseudomonadota bacterium]
MNKKMALIATKGTLDWAYPPFILASTASALGYDVEIFFTFYGLRLLEKELKLKVSPLGNPGMPMPIPVPVIIQAMPFMQDFVTSMMKKKMASKGIAPLEELRDLCLDADVQFIACQMTVDLFEMDINNFINEVTYAGAAAFFEFAGEANISMYI